MSYDIIFVRVGSAPDRLARARELAESEFDEETESPPSTEATARRRALIDDLLKLHPSLRYFPDHDEAHGGYVDVDEVEGPIPPIHLGIDSGMVAVPNEAGATALQSILPVIDVFARHGYVAYDEQTDSLIDHAEDLTSALARFTGASVGVVNELRPRGETAIEPTRPQRRPWWRFW